MAARCGARESSDGILDEGPATWPCRTRQGGGRSFPPASWLQAAANLIGPFWAVVSECEVAVDRSCRGAAGAGPSDRPTGWHRPGPGRGPNTGSRGGSARGGRPGLGAVLGQSSGQRGATADSWQTRPPSTAYPTCRDVLAVRAYSMPITWQAAATSRERRPVLILLTSGVQVRDLRPFGNRRPSARGDVSPGSPCGTRGRRMRCAGAPQRDAEVEGDAGAVRIW